jgi:hypothetical protein
MVSKKRTNAGVQMKIVSRLLLGFVFIFLFNKIFAQSIYEPRDLSKVKWSFSDFGKMWTFDSVPVDSFKNNYGFTPSQEWLDDVRMSALQFSSFCSAAFVSADGLIMTNHHCGRSWLPELSPQGEDYLRDGYYAKTLNEELKIPSAYVDQLRGIENVTEEILKAMSLGKDNNEKVTRRNMKIKEIEEKFSKETGLVCKVVQLYNGSKYSLYEYKRYNDIRLVMAPDFQIASTGWDWDNFTYPRYELDFMFFRAYENDKPVKCNHFFKWSKQGAIDGEPIFVIGRPGSTQRLASIAEMDYLRDKIYNYNLKFYNELYQVYYDLFKSRIEKHSDLLNMVMSIGNARKSFAGRYMTFNDEYIMAKKKDFEKDFITKVNADSSLNKEYGHVWLAIKDNITEMRKIIDEYSALLIGQRIKIPFTAAALNAIKYANQLKLAPENRESAFKPDSLNLTLDKLYPLDLDQERDSKLLRALVNFMTYTLPEDHIIRKEFFNGKTGNDAVSYLLEKSNLSSKEKFLKYLKESKPEEILNSLDPFIKFVQFGYKRRAELDPLYKEIDNTLSVLNQMMGEAAYKIFGDKIPPDATSTLRISDGRIEGYEYNGTVAPGKTTFYGMYDRWNSFGKNEYPWGLHPRWQKIPDGFDLSLPVGFASTNDIVGGNSGSSVININKEVVGLVHDGNIESLAGDFIFLPENNRTVATDSWGLIEALHYYFKADRLVDELRESKIK